MTREELIKALEKAEGSSRELDAEIIFDLHAVPVGILDDGGPNGYLWPQDDPSWNLGIRFPGKHREWFSDKQKDEKILIWRDQAWVLVNSCRIPPLTSSIDAALTLVPDGANAWGFDFDSADTVGYFSRNHVPDGHFYFEGRHKLPALALCIAALKARVDE